MAVYGVHFYGTATYGAPLFVQLASNIFAVPKSYDSLFLSWGLPAGSGTSEWDTIRLLRSSYGVPTGLHDGVTLFEDDLASARTAYHDEGLEPGRFYYYALFVRLTADETWVTAGGCSGLVTEPWAWGDKLFSRLPFFHQEQDLTYADVFGQGPLYRYLSLIGYQVDRIQSEMRSLTYVNDVDLMAGGLLPVLAESFGIPWETELGQRLMRLLLKNYVYLVKMKGTKPGIEGVASALSGFGATAVVGKNLLLDYNDSDQKEAVGHWIGASQCDVARSTSGDIPLADIRSLDVTATDDGTMVAFLGSSADGTLIPIEPDTDYTWSAYTKAATDARSVQVGIVYYDEGFSTLSTTNSTLTANSTATWDRHSVTATSGATARWAGLRVSGASVPTGEVHRFAGFQFEKASAVSDFESARTIGVYFDAERTNLLPNPSFELDTTGWSTLSNAVRSTAEAHGDGAASLLMTAPTGAPMEVDATATFWAVEGETYTLSAYFLLDSGTFKPRLISAYFDDTLDTLPDLPAGEWVRHSLVFTATATGDADIYLTNGTSSAGATAYVDNVMVEKTEFLNPYFDASFAPAADYLWEGAAHGSQSFYYPRRDVKDVRVRLKLPEFTPAGVEVATHYGETVPASSV